MNSQVVDKDHCLLCEGNLFATVAENCRDLYMGKPGVCSYCRCLQCGLVQQRPIPQDVSAFYDDYPVHAKKSRMHTRLQRALLSRVYLHPKLLAGHELVLDFGCGDGWYLEWCREFNIACVGFEENEVHAAELSARLGLPIYSSLDRLIAAYPQKFDLVTLHFVVEHLTDIRGTLSRLRDLVKPGGCIRYVVPNIESWEFRLFQKKWHNLDPPRHISFPNARHARQLADEFSLIYAGEQPVPCPNGVAGSIPVWLTGRFRQWLFLLALPPALLATWLFPSGNRVYRLLMPKT